MSLQLLLENVIKHNVISKEDPLTITIQEKNNYISISNNLQRKSNREVTSLGIGLENLTSTYALLTSEPIIISNGPDDFSVSIPLLNIER